MGILNNDIKVRAGLYMRVSTEDQAREDLVYQNKKNDQRHFVSLKVIRYMIILLMLE